MISTSDLSELPDIARFRRLTSSLAMLDAIVCPEWEYRYYSFNSKWVDGESMASMRNGSGDQWFSLICESGIAIVGLDHEAPAFNPGEPPEWIFRDLPAVFHANVRDEPAFDTKNSTFCIWCLVGDAEWSCGRPGLMHDDPPEDGSAWLLSILLGNPQQYVDFASDYYEISLALEDVCFVYEHTPLTQEMVARLNPDVDFGAVQAEAGEIGYPITV